MIPLDQSQNIETGSSNLSFSELPEWKFFMRVAMVFLSTEGYSQKWVAELLGVSRNSVRSNLDRFQSGGVEALRQLNYRKPVSKQEASWPMIEQSFRSVPPRTSAEAAFRMSEISGIPVSTRQAIEIMKKKGMRFLATVQVPAKADLAQQAEFVEQTLQPLLKKAENGDCKVYFVDAAHFLHGAYPTQVWAFGRTMVKTSSGRQRMNVLSALDATTKWINSRREGKYVNASTAEALMEDIREASPHAEITLLMDNVPYQRCAKVKLAAERLGIEIIYLPPYSPNLNIIERLWKFIKKKCLNGYYYPDFIQFQNAINEVLENCNLGCYKEELDSLLAHNFQLFSSAQNLAA